MRQIRRNAPQLVVSAFLVFMMSVTFLVASSLVSGLIGNTLVRFFMNGVLVLSMVPMLNAGVGINYGLPIGIMAGLLGMCLAVNFHITGLSGFAAALLFSIVISLPIGYGYARILNRVRGQEEVTGLFCGFSAVFIMSFFWAVAPFSNREMLWPIGGNGLRPTIGLASSFGQVLNNPGSFNIAGIHVPVSGLLFFVLLCVILYFFSRTKTGWALSVVGENETFAALSGVDVTRSRTLAVILSTMLGAIGICVYAQSYGFIELYDAPLTMAFPAASAILLGGSTGRRANVVHVLLGTFLFQAVYVFSSPLANTLVMPEMSEILRVIVTNGIILYALLYQAGGKEQHEKG
jgi:simple sugar transport system permease protein